MNSKLGILLGLTAALVLTAGDAFSKASNWVHPKTPWGDPDLQGTWPLNHISAVPLQRPKKFGDRLHFTEEELAQQAASVESRNELYKDEIDADRIGLGHWVESIDVPPQTSLIVDPPDGQFPSMTEVGKQMGAKLGSSWDRDVWDKPEDFDSWDRCITRGLPASMFPAPYNNGIQIVQSPGYVVINLEMIHEARIVPLDGMPQLDPAVKQWLGDSRGHWEGNTLVVETTNFNGLAAMTTPTVTGSPPGKFATSPAMKIVERFQRVDDDTIDYSITVNDPVTQTRPWTAAFPWQKDDDYQYFEYACHEDNNAIRGFITNSRVLRAQRAAGKNPTVQTPWENIQERRTGVQE